MPQCIFCDHSYYHNLETFFSLSSCYSEFILVVLHKHGLISRSQLFYTTAQTEPPMRTNIHLTHAPSIFTISGNLTKHSDCI
jgi:hypothetical protein